MAGTLADLKTWIANLSDKLILKCTEPISTGTAVKILRREELRLENGFATRPDVKHVDNIIALADVGESPKSSPTPDLKRGRYDVEWDDKLVEEAAANFRSGTGSAI